MAAPTAPKFDILHPRHMDPGATSNWMNNPTQLLRAKPLFLDGKFWVNLGLVGPWVCLVCHFYGAMNWRISYPATCLSGQRHIQDGQLTAMDRANPRSPAVIRFRPPVRSYPEQPSYPEQLPLPGAPSSFNCPPVPNFHQRHFPQLHQQLLPAQRNHPGCLGPLCLRDGNPPWLRWGSGHGRPRAASGSAPCRRRRSTRILRRRPQRATVAKAGRRRRRRHQWLGETTRWGRGIPVTWVCYAV